MQYSTVICEKKDAVATITLNRPQNMNALDFKLGEELLDCLLRIGEDAEVRAVVLSGAGRAFSAGGDVKVMQEALSESPPLCLKKLTNLLHPIISAIRRMPKPVIAAVNGFASGAGFSLTLACDLVIAAESARFNSAYILIGLSPDGSLTYFLPRLIGLQRANWLFFSGEQVSAQQGHQMGFVNQVVADEELAEAAQALARRLAAAPTMAIAMTKQVVNTSLTETLETQMENERIHIACAGGTEDFREGLDAFFTKRKAEFKGR